MNHFPFSIDLVLRHEGGYVNNPKDPGGETKYGISKRAYPGEDIKNLSIDRAKAIYYNDYWLKNHLEKIADKEVAAALLDTVVNHGKGPMLAQKAAQDIGVPLSVDGKLGPQSIASINSLPAKQYLASLYNVRKDYYYDLVLRDPEKAVFLKGWLARIDKWKVEGSALAAFLLLAAAAALLYAKKKNLI